MEFLPSKKLCPADGLSREPLEDRVIAAMNTENEIKNVLHNTIRVIDNSGRKDSSSRNTTSTKDQIAGKVNKRSI